MLGNLVRETSNSPGTGTTVTLNGATAGRRTFLSEFGAGGSCFYFITDGTQTEAQIGTVGAGPPHTLTRGTPLWTSAVGGSSPVRLNFTGTVTVYGTLPAQRAVWRDAANNVVLPGSVVTTVAGVGFKANSPGAGKVALNTGIDTKPGYISFHDAADTRTGYIGWSVDGVARMMLNAEGGWGWRITGWEVTFDTNVGVNFNQAVAMGANLTVAGAVVVNGNIQMAIEHPVYLYTHSGTSAAYWAANGSGDAFLATGTAGVAARIIAYASGGGYQQGIWTADEYKANWITFAGNTVMHLGMGAGDIGSYAWASCYTGTPGSVGFGGLVAGSALTPADVATGYGGTLAGTWRCHGWIGNTMGGGATLFQRVA